MVKAVLFDCIGVLYVHGGLNQELLNFSQGLRPKSKVGLLTNLSADSLHKYFTQEECQKYFYDLVVSGEVGMIKPARYIYEYAANRLGVDVSECVLIDDSRLNCEGAIKAGMQAILYQSTEQVIRDINQLVGK